MDTTATLIGLSGPTFDKYGNQVFVDGETTILCDLRSVTRSEFYAAARNGLNPEKILRISHAADYNGERFIKLDGEPGKIYTVIRAYNIPGEDAVELTLQEKTGNVEI